MRFILVAFAAATALLFATPALASGLPVVYFDNQSVTVPQADVTASLPDFQVAVSRDLAASWGTDAVLTSDPAYKDSAQMTVVISDGVDCFGCFGYHDISNGRPTAYVDANAAALYGESWQLVASHELDEMLVDPWLNRLTQWHSRTWLVEVCDPPEDGLYAYFVGGLPMSDFITPAWYGAPRGRPVDFNRKLRKPGAIGKHGYASYLDPNNPGGWGQVFADRGYWR